MEGFIAIMVPSIIGLNFFEILNGELNNFDRLSVYSLLLIFSNIINIVFSYFFFNIKYDLCNQLSSLPIFCVKYIILSLIVNFILVFILIIFKENISFNIKVGNKNEKKFKKEEKSKKFSK